MKTYSVVVLGLSGSGKTVYLASMYKRLEVQGEIGFFLKIEDETQRNRLIKIYHQATQFNKPWPEGTTYGEVSEWNFICCVQKPGLEKFTACHFTYLDYAGGRINNTTEDSDPLFRSKLENADAILGLLDGEKVLDLMRSGENQPLDEYLSYIIAYMQIARENPVHFVISKWDIIQDEFDFRQVRDKLLQINSFRQIVENRLRADSNVRLIPVSSLGKGFAELQSDGTMRKVEGANLKPFQVEMPIACVIPDIIRLKYKQKELEIQEVQENESFSEVQPNLSFLEKIRRYTVNYIQAVQDKLPSNYQINPEVIKTIIEFVDKAPREKELAAAQRNKELRKTKEEKMKAITDEQSSLAYAISCFLHVEDTLDSRFPESRLRLPYYDEN